MVLIFAHFLHNLIWKWCTQISCSNDFNLDLSLYMSIFTNYACRKLCHNCGTIYEQYNT